MARRDRHEQQTSRDVQRAVGLVARARGLTDDQSACALGDRAVGAGISLHAAALAVLSTNPTDELLFERSETFSR